jgi:predicted dienelactone hydrolase
MEAAMRAAAVLYPSMGLADDQRLEVTLSDPARIGQPDRQIPIAFYWSSAAPLPMPIVVLSHGGAFGHDNPRRSLEKWAPVLAQHGYLAVAIAHTPRTDIERIVLTMNLGGTLPQCREFKHLGYDRPLDFARVAQQLAEQSADPPWNGGIDLDAVGYMGHSAGAGSVMMAAGAGREYMAGLGLSFAQHPVPRAFVAMSPEGAGDDGFTPESWDRVTRPVLMCTGASDGDHPHERRDPYEYMPAGDKYLLWVEHPGAEHMVFAGETDACVETTGDQAFCDEMQKWLRSAVRAFLDAHLRQDQAAADYLASDSLVQSSAGVIEWRTK